MILNKNRQTVEAYEEAGKVPVASCPECGELLVSHMCEVKRSHFAHYPRKSDERRRCNHEETEWHLAWKFAFLELPGWQVEYGLQAGAQSYRADAWHAEGLKVREFVHSLSPYYVAKHEALLTLGYNMFWLIHGEAFQSDRLEAFNCRNGTRGVRHMLKPRARQLAEKLGAAKCKVH